MEEGVGGSSGSLPPAHTAGSLHPHLALPSQSCLFVASYTGRDGVDRGPTLVRDRPCWAD